MMNKYYTYYTISVAMVPESIGLAFIKCVLDSSVFLEAPQMHII